MDTFLLSQILAALALGFGLASYQFRATRWILLGMLVCNLLNASHFFLLDRPGPASLQLVTAARFSVVLFTTDRRAMLLFLVVTAGIFIASFTNALSVVACAGTLFATYGSFQPDNCRLRRFFMVGNSLWLTHNILAATPAGAVTEATYLTSNVVGYWRHCKNRGTPSTAEVADAAPGE